MEHDLELVPTEALVDELIQRCTGVAIVLVRRASADDVQNTRGGSRLTWWWTPPTDELRAGMDTLHGYVREGSG